MAQVIESRVLALAKLNVIFKLFHVKKMF